MSSSEESSLRGLQPRSGTGSSSVSEVASAGALGDAGGDSGGGSGGGLAGVGGGSGGGRLVVGGGSGGGSSGGFWLGIVSSCIVVGVVCEFFWGFWIICCLFWFCASCRLSLIRWW